MGGARSYRGTSEADLVRIVRAGPPDARDDAAAELFGRYQLRVYAWCRRYVRDHDQALDLSQEALTAAWRALHTWEERAPFGGWLFTIAHHACLRALRRPGPATAGDADLETLPDPRPDPATLLEDAQAREALNVLVREALEPLEQRAIWLRYAERMPVEEITKLLDLRTASGARGLLQTAKRKLRAAGERRPADQGGSP